MMAATAGWSRRRILAALGLLGAAPARGWADQPGRYPRLRRGINIHTLLNWPDVESSGGTVRYVWPPFAAPQFQMGAGELAGLRAAGFDFVRLTADPSIFMATTGERFATLRTKAEQVVDAILAADLNVVFDLHPVAVNPPLGPAPIVDAASDRVFRQYADMVERVAAMLARYPANRLALEPINEPWITTVADAPRWQPMMETLHARARAAAPDLPLVLTGALWSDIGGLLRLDPTPFAGSNVLYTFHYYDPHTFTHQGVEGDDAQYLAGLSWPENRSQANVALEGSLDRIRADAKLSGGAGLRAQARTRDLVAELLAGRYDTDRIGRDFDRVVRWGSDHGIAPDRILLGEFGCVVSSHGKPVGESRARWVGAVRQAAESRGMPWAFWSYKGYGGMTLAGPDGRIDPALVEPLGLT